MGKGHGKLCRVFCFDLTLQTVDGHADFLRKAAIFLAILDFIAHQIALIRTRQVQILLVIIRSSGGCSQLTAILGVCTVNGGIAIESLFNRDFLICIQINVRTIVFKLDISTQNNIWFTIPYSDTIFCTYNFTTVDFCFGSILIGCAVCTKCRTV